MNNRLAALGISDEGNSRAGSFDGLANGSNSRKSSASSSQPTFMEDFFKKVESVKESIQYIKHSTKEIGEINEQANLAAGDKEQELSAQLDPIIGTTNQKAAQAKGVLQFLKEQTQEMKDSQKDNPDQAKGKKSNQIRIRDDLQIMLTRRFVDTMKEYQQAQSKYKSDIKKKVGRQVRIADPNATDEDIDDVLRTGDTGAFYKSKILTTAAEPIRNAYADVVDKYKDVLKLEQSVAELHQMFLDMALLVEQQGEMLDQIEYQIQSASDYIEDGNEEISKALEHQKEARKRQCCILVIVLVVVGLLIGGITIMSG